MALLIWQDDLNTGIEVIDDQHRRIVSMINQLHQAQTGASALVVADVMDELVDYTLSHFAFEEELIYSAEMWADTMMRLSPIEISKLQRITRAQERMLSRIY